MIHTYSQSFQISSFDLNPNATARLTSIANYLQEMAYQHAKRLEWGFHDLEKKNVAWVLSRFHLKLYQLPGWDDTITIETWPRGVDRLFAIRDFKITNKSGDLIGDATSYWLIVDINTHRPTRITEDIIKIVTREETVFNAKSEKLEISGELSEVYKRKVSFSDLDIVGHVNNVKYMEWCMDAIPLEIHLNHELAELEINFLHEAKYGEEIQLNHSESGQRFMVNAVNTSTNKECVRARMQFR
jgi:medium-chain acyl-[acyl-carrier-protein] hydrolase